VLRRLGFRGDRCAATAAACPDAIRDGVPRLHRNGPACAPACDIAFGVTHRRQLEETSRVSTRRPERSFQAGNHVLGDDQLVAELTPCRISANDRLPRWPGSGARSRDVAASGLRHRALASARAAANDVADAAARSDELLAVAHRDGDVAATTDRFVATAD
jgi:hypothetical protein